LKGFKNFSISKQEVESRFLLKPEMVDQYLGSGRHVIITGGHYNNWELYALAMPLYHRFSGLAIYKKLHNRFLDEKLRSSREKYGLRMIPMKVTRDYFNRDAKRPKYGFVFGADQSPRNGSNAYWMKFLSQDTALLFGAEKYAKEYDAPVVFGEITNDKVKVLKDMNYSEFITLMPLLILVILLGVYPNIILDTISTSVEKFSLCLQY